MWRKQSKMPSLSLQGLILSNVRLGMLSDGAYVFTKDNLDFYLNKKGKEFRKLSSGKMPDTS